MQSKVRIKIGDVEIEYEGSEDFLKKELPKLLSAFSTLYKESGILTSPTLQSVPTVNEGAGEAAGNAISGTTTTIAHKLKCSTGPDLVIAAAARLTLSLGRESFSRKELASEMKNATSFCKVSYISNLTSSLKRLRKKGKLNEPTTNTYALSPAAIEELKTRLAE